MTEEDDDGQYAEMWRNEPQTKKYLARLRFKKDLALTEAMNLALASNDAEVSRAAMRYAIYVEELEHIS